MSYPPPPQQQPYGPVDGGGKRRLRGRIPLRLALIFGVIGVALVVVGAVFLVKGSLGKIDGFARVSIAEGSKTVHLTRTGNYVGYYETPTSSSHRGLVRMQITDSSGDLVALKLYGPNTNLTYDDGDRHGEALFRFTIDKAGDYRVQVRADGAPSGAEVALGESIAGSLVAGVLTLIPGILLVIAAIVLLIVGLVRRGRHKRQLESGHYPGGPPPGQWPQQPPPGWQQPPPGWQPQG